MSVTRIAALLALLLAPQHAEAADGAVEIDQVRAVAGGVTATDAPGFPVTIDAPGLYLLTSDLEVDTTHGIEILSAAAAGVTLDLGGFSILGPGTCSGQGAGLDCQGQANGRAGVHAQDVPNVTVTDGNVAGFWYGLRLGDQCRVERVRTRWNEREGVWGGHACILHEVAAFENGNTGARVGDAGLVRASVAQRNFFHGVLLGNGGLVRENASRENGQNGFFLGAGGAIFDSSASANANTGIAGNQILIDGNSARSNTIGLGAGPGSLYTNDAVNVGDNESPFAEAVTGTGVGGGPNVCDGGTCP